MSKVETFSWDAAEYLETKEDMAAYLEAALEEGDPSLVAVVLGDLVRSKGMAQMADETGLHGEVLRQTLSADGNPDFSTILKVVRALGLSLRATVA